MELGDVGIVAVVVTRTIRQRKSRVALSDTPRGISKKQLPRRMLARLLCPGNDFYIDLEEMNDAPMASILLSSEDDMGRPILFMAVGEVLPETELKPAQRDIIDNWLNRNNLFSIGQIAERNGISRGASKRQIMALMKLGLVKVWRIPKHLMGMTSFNDAAPRG